MILLAGAQLELGCGERRVHYRKVEKKGSYCRRQDGLRDDEVLVPQSGSHDSSRPCHIYQSRPCKPMSQSSLPAPMKAAP